MLWMLYFVFVGAAVAQNERARASTTHNRFRVRLCIDHIHYKIALGAPHPKLRWDISYQAMFEIVFCVETSTSTILKIF
ncbi:hypothetical protein NQ317_006253 [Molorchus minor]|uniref:Secreted protein n=1 Tax=Molorchus minor TaxID=1323400 RepID=A0ABQ9K6E6_9CUCU|nr:hypothetical protein NQ317_006253 [Molorchus minor]